MGPSELLILGGMNTVTMLNDGFVLDVNAKTVKQVRSRDVELDFPANAWYQSQPGKVVALAISHGQLRIISYMKGQSKTNFIADFGSTAEE